MLYLYLSREKSCRTFKHLSYYFTSTIGLKAKRWKGKRKNDKICSLAKVTTKRDRRNVISESKYPISVTRLEIREPPLKWLPGFISVEPRNTISPCVSSFFPLQTYFSPPCPPFSSSSFDLWFVEAAETAFSHLHNTTIQPSDNERCTRSNRIPYYFFSHFHDIPNLKRTLQTVRSNLKAEFTVYSSSAPNIETLRDNNSLTIDKRSKKKKPHPLEKYKTFVSKRLKTKWLIEREESRKYRSSLDWLRKTGEPM